MNNTPGSGGRKTNITGGSGSVGKGGSANTSGPVGRKDGYSGRTGSGTGGTGPRVGGTGPRVGGTGQRVPTSDSRYSGHRASGTGLLGSILGAGSKGGIGKIVLILVVAVALFFIVRSIGGGGCSAADMPDNNNGTNTGNNGGISDLISQFIPTSGFNNYDASDATAPTALSASTSATSADMTVAKGAREKRTVIKGDGTDTVTLMVYMCGTDLEAKYGMATNDLNEMLHAELNDNRVNIIVETGGTKTWKNSVISNTTNQRWKVTSGGLLALDKNVGKKSMTDPNTLSDFIKYCKTNYPANRYMLIFWDHGGGSLTGYGYDQYFSGSMTLDKINKALKDGGCTFDFIGFDACLMATMETALVTEQYADYLIGSEETEPGCGWYYTNWLTALSKNTSINTVSLGKMIVDDFNDVCKKNNSGDSTTLSVIDLAEFAGTVPDAFSKFAANVSQMLDGDEYDTVAKARSDAREFGESSGINHVDLVHLASGINTAEANKLIEVLKGCIKYNRTSRSMANAYGMSIYFPFSSFKSVGSAVNLYNSIGMDENYSAALRSFASLAAGGQIATGTTSSPVGSLLGSFTGTTSSSSSSDVLSSLLGGVLGGSSSGGAGSLLSGIMGGDYSSWFEGDRVLAHSDYYDSHVIYADDMELTEKNGGYVLSLSKEKWDIVQDVQLNVFLDDGSGYIDLGMDNVYRFDNDGDLLIEYDRTWLALNGQVVPYYMISNVVDGDTYTITGRIPAYLNGELVYIIVVFDNEKPENEYGYVAGARYIYEDNETDAVGRGLIEIKDGDKLDFICDYYGYDGSYQGSFYFGETIRVDGEIQVSNVSIGSSACKVSYCLTDIYANEFWTLSLKF